MSEPPRPFAEFGPPRRVEGGIRAKTARGAIGQSWWSRRFLAVLESFALGTRLTRGRAYARAGQVIDLAIAPGVVSATVQGSQPDPYRVTVRMKPFPELSWARIEVLLAEQALYSARLLAGEVPPELEQVLADAGAPLFPTAVRELAMACSCPDRAVPCKHLAATFYLLAEAFDDDPFEILHWRGRSREALLSRLRTLRSDAPTFEDASVGPAPAGPAPAGPAPAGPAPAGPAPAGPAPAGVGRAAAPGAAVGAAAVGTAHALAELPEQLIEDSADRFWLTPQALPGRPTTLAGQPEVLLRQLPTPAPELGGHELVEQLRTAYRRFADAGKGELADPGA